MSICSTDSQSVSVIIPTFNSAAWIGDALDSVVRQTHRAAEIIVVDDGSTDDTASIIAAHPAQPRYLRQPNAGPASARNNGAKHATGSWLAFLDADDLWLAQKLELQLRAAHDHQSDAVFCGMLQCGPQGETPVVYQGPMARHLLLPAMIRTNVLSGGGSTLLIRREAFNALGGFDGSVGGSEDRELFIRLIDARPVAYVTQPLARIRVGPLGYGGDPLRQQRNAIEILRRHGHLLDGLPNAPRIRREARARIHERTGMHYLVTGRTRLALSELTRSLRIWPLLPNPWKALINLSTGRRRYAAPRGAASI